MEVERLSANHVEILRRRFDFDVWRDRNTLGEQLLSWNANPALHMPGYELMRVTRRVPQSVAVAPVPARAQGKVRDIAGREAEAATLPPMPPLRSVQVLWRAVNQPEALLRVDLFERDSLIDAHEYLLRLLGEFESPLVAPKDTSVGDVAFGGRAEGLLLFARANLVYLVRNIGRASESVLPIALGLDADTISSPEPAEVERELQDAVGREAAAAQSADEQVEIPVADLEALPPTSSIKVFAPAGDLHVRTGRIVFRGPAGAARALRVLHYGG